VGRSRAGGHAGPDPVGVRDGGAHQGHRLLRAGRRVVSTTDPVQFMSHFTTVEYRVPDPSPLNVYFAEQLATGRIVGHKCPECGKVYMPPRGYCPLCVVETSKKDEVDVADRGTVTTFSIITPLQ